MADQLDCLVIGGGPAGLTAAIYLRASTSTFWSWMGARAVRSGSPALGTTPGFPGGSAARLLERGGSKPANMAPRSSEFVTKLERDEQSGLHCPWGSGVGGDPLSPHRNRRDQPPSAHGRRPSRRGPVPRLRSLHLSRSATAEVTDKRVGVIGGGDHGVAEAVFIRSYTADVTLIAPDKALRLKPEDSRKLKDAGIECVDGPAQAVAIDGDCIVVTRPKGITPSTASIRRSARTRTRNWRRWSAPSSSD